MAKLDDLIAAIQNQSATLYQINANIISLAVRQVGAGPQMMAGGGHAVGVVSMVQAGGQAGASAISAAGYSPSPFGGVGNLVQGLGSIVDLMGPYGPLVGGIVKLGGSALKSVDALTDWTRHLMDSNMELAKMSPAMMAVRTNQEIKDMMFQMKMGERLARTTGDLSDSFNNLRESTTDLNVLWKTTLSELGQRFATGLERIIFYIETGKDLFKTSEFQNRFKNMDDQSWYDNAIRDFWNKGIDPFANTGHEEAVRKAKGVPIGDQAGMLLEAGKFMLPFGMGR